MSTENMEKTDYRDCADASVDIPKKNFRSAFTWALYESTRSYEPYVMVVWFGGLLFCLPYVISSSHFFWSTITVILLLECVMLVPLICMICRGIRARSLISRRKKTLAEAAEEVFSSDKETLAIGWDKVASRLNRKFYKAGDWKTPYCLFDGLHCEIFFRCYVLKSIYEEEELDGCEKSCLRSAVSIYQQRIMDQFSRDKEDTSALAEDNLPADSYHSIYTWRFKNSLRSVGHKVWLVSMLPQVFSGHTWSLRLTNIIVVILVFVALSTTSIGTTLLGSTLKISTTRDRIRLLAVISDVAPGENSELWDIVAKRINAYLNEGPNVTGVQRFFDGKECCSFFKKQFKPLMSGKIKDYQVATYEILPLITSAAGSSSV